MAKKIEEGNSIFFSHPPTADNTFTMTYEYDDHGIKCLNYDGDYRPVEPHCLNCGDKPDDCECVTFCPAPYWDEEGEQWIDEEQDEDGFEDCVHCGYTHHSEDKCPTGKQCEKYERWATPDEEQDEE